MSEHLGMRSVAILATLIGRERHGYDIMRQIALDSDHRLVLGPATLYTNLKRLTEMGFIVELEERQDPEHHDVRRRYYKLTEKGETVAQAELADMERLVSVMRQRLV